MKNLAPRILFAVSLTALVTGCIAERIDDPSADEPQPITFSARIDGRTSSTRVSGTEWEPGDEIGIFMFASGEPDESANAPKTCLDSNVRHIYSATSDFHAADPDEALFYPANGQAVDFAAYHPFDGGLTGGKYPIDISKQIDLLYSKNARAEANAVTPLTFKHLLSRLSLTVSATDAATNLGGLRVWISGAATRGTLDLASGKLTLDPLRGTIDAKVETASGGAVSANAILLPEADVDLSVHFAFADGEESVLELSGKNLASGVDHRYTISVDESAQPVVVGSTIDDWEANEGGTVSIGKGSNTRFYTETFGTEKLLTLVPIGDFQGWSSGAAGVAYESESAGVRSKADDPENPFIYLPAGGTVSISGWSVDRWSNVVFSCRVRAWSGSMSAGGLQFFDGKDGAELFPTGLAADSTIGAEWVPVSFSLPADKLCIRTNGAAVCLDDLVLSGLARPAAR